MEILSEEYYRDDDLCPLVKTSEYLDYLMELGYHIYYYGDSESDAFCFTDRFRDLHFIKVCIWRDYLEGSVEDEYNNSEKTYIVDGTEVYSDSYIDVPSYYEVKLEVDCLKLYRRIYKNKLVFTLKLKTCNVKSARTAL